MCDACTAETSACFSWTRCVGLEPVLCIVRGVLKGLFKGFVLVMAAGPLHCKLLLHSCHHARVSCCMTHAVVTISPLTGRRLYTNQPVGNQILLPQSLTSYNLAAPSQAVPASNNLAGPGFLCSRVQHSIAAARSTATQPHRLATFLTARMGQGPNKKGNQTTPAGAHHTHELYCTELCCTAHVCQHNTPQPTPERSLLQGAAESCCMPHQAQLLQAVLTNPSPPHPQKPQKHTLCDTECMLIIALSALQADWVPVA